MGHDQVKTGERCDQTRISYDFRKITRCSVQNGLGEGSAFFSGDSSTGAVVVVGTEDLAGGDREVIF